LEISQPATPDVFNGIRAPWERRCSVVSASSPALLVGEVEVQKKVSVSAEALPILGRRPEPGNPRCDQRCF
jgi:hypothetical protein